MKNYRFLFVVLFILTLIVGMLPGFAFPAQAQSDEGWTDPVNLSNSGSTTNPSILIDEKGLIHVFWVDEFDGYKYANSSAGENWTEPQTVNVPFPTPEEGVGVVKPVFLAGADGNIHILWEDDEGALQYVSATSSGLGSPSTWTGEVTLADSIVEFDAVVDSQGALHIGYITNIDSDESPSGIYYRQLDGSGWSEVVSIYPSKYYRSLDVTDDANVQLATTTEDEVVNVYITWDDRSQRRIFLEKSSDGGKDWDGVLQVQGPEEFSGVEMPFNIDIGAVGKKILLLWQAGLPGGQCTQYSQWSTDGAQEFGLPVKMLEEFSQCPQNDQFLLSESDFSVVLLNTLSDISLMAWDGSRWSAQLIQNEIASIVNPVTLGSVLIGCQNATFFNSRIYIVGCDTAEGGDIWFTSRPVGAIGEWFPPPTMWSRPVTLTSADEKLSSLLSIADQNNHIHNLWIQPISDSDGGVMIQYARWDGEKWSNPVTVNSGSQLNPSQLSLSTDNLGKLLVAWVDELSGDMFFTWANSENASSVSEWETPIYIPSISSANSSPNIVADASGRMIVSFAVPINEERGIYIVESEDFGGTWSKPYRVFDASAANWHMVDQPKIALTSDGKLHILFNRYSLSGEQRRSMGLYYVQSSDGGILWTEPELVSEQPIRWSELISYGESNLHRIWQEQAEAAMVSKHQFSSDGGITWSTPNTLSSISNANVLDHVSMDFFGNLSYIQLTNPDAEPSVLSQRWDESGWKVEPPMVLGIDTETRIPSALTSSISSNGDLVASFVVDAPDWETKPQSEIFSIARTVAQSDGAPTPYTALIATPASNQAGIQGVSEIPGATNTASSPLEGIEDTRSFWSKNRSLVGLLFLGGIVGVMVLLFLLSSSTKKKKKGKQ